MPGLAAREFLSDLCGILSDEEGEEWLRDMKGFGRTLEEGMRDPWE